MGFDEGLFVWCYVLFEWNWLVFGLELEAFYVGFDLIRGDVEAGGDEWDVGIDVVGLFAEEEAGDGGIVVDNDAAFAVEELAAGGEDGDLTDAVLFGEGAVVIFVEYSQAPHAREQGKNEHGDEVLRHGQFDRGNFFVVT